MWIEAPVGGRPVHVTDLAAGPAACRRLRRGRQGGFTRRRQTGSRTLGSKAGTGEPDSSYAWWRLAASLAASTIGGIGLWSAVILLPAIQAEFGVGRAGASAPYTATLIGFAIGGLLLGRLADRRGIGAPLLIGAATLGAGYIAAANVRAYWQFVLVQAVLIGTHRRRTRFRWVLSRSANPQPSRGFAPRRRPWPGSTASSTSTSVAPSSASSRPAPRSARSPPGSAGIPRPSTASSAATASATGIAASAATSP